MADSSTRVIQGIILILGLVGLYYLYQYLYSAPAPSVTLLSGSQAANPQTLPSPIYSDRLPPLYQGGEFTISTWVYVQNWSVNQNKNKSIVRIGGQRFDTIRIYLGASNPQLMVRVNTGENDSLRTDDNKFIKLQTGADLLESTSICDIPSIDMQRWVSVVVVVNGMTCDVYIDGKLIRSCVLPSYFKVDKNYAAYMLDDGTGSPGGFGGTIATTTLYGYALSPDVIYTNYILGPSQITNFWQYVSSFFAPTK
jgi:hypothetical protein